MLPDGSERDFNNLVSHVEKFQEKPKNRMKLSQIYWMLSEFFDKTNLPPKEQVLDILAKISVNAFPIFTTHHFDTRITIGEGLYLEGSVFDHSCRPNVEQLYAGKELYFRCIRDDVSDFSAVKISYADDILLLPSERRAYIRENYFFDCQCASCSDQDSQEEEEAYGRTCLKCPRCGGGVPVNEELKEAEINCGHCKKAIPPEHVTTYWMVKRDFRDYERNFGPIEAGIYYAENISSRRLFFPTEREHLATLFTFIDEFPKVQSPDSALNKVWRAMMC